MLAGARRSSETLTLMPITLLTGFIASEHTKPLTYITKGMMATKFYTKEKSDITQETQPAVSLELLRVCW